MYQRESSSWRDDGKWFSAIVLALSVAVLVPLFSFVQITSSERAVPILERILRQSLLPSEAEGVAAAVREEIGYTPGGELELLPGTGVTAASDELSGLTAGRAATRIAESLADRVVAQGAQAVSEDLTGSTLAVHFDAAVAGPAADLTEASVMANLLPEGLDNGSRMANWPLQAQQNPGEAVQPIVGVFVTVQPQDLSNLTSRQIGELVVAELAAVLLAQGEESATELVSNQTLLQSLSATAQGPVRERLRRLFETLLLPFHETMASRLERATDAQEALSAVGEGRGFGGVVDPGELAGLSAEEADDLVLERLAAIAYENGSGPLLETLVEETQQARASTVAPLVDLLSRQSHRRYLRYSWLIAGLALLMLVLVAALSRGWGRIANPGFALALPAAAGALVANRLLGWLPAPVANGASTPPQGPVAAGLLDSLGQLLSVAGSTLPQGAMALLVRNHLIVVALGAGLILLSLLIRLFRALRPRRRSLI